MKGHGQPGLLDNLRPYPDLLDDAAASRRPYLDFLPGAPITASGSWVAYLGGPAYQFNGLLSYSISGVALDVVGVETTLGALVRVETLAECIAFPGTYYAVDNIGSEPPAGAYDGSLLYDTGGLTYDHTPAVDLWVHLPADTNPNTQTVVPLLGYYASTRGEVHPQLGPEKLQNGGFESLTGWTEVLSGAGYSTAQDSVLFYGRGSTASLKLVSTGAAVGNSSRYQDRTMVLAAPYRLAGYYRTDAAFSPNLAARLIVGNTAGTSNLYADGRDADANGQATLRPTYGEWRGFLFDFLAPSTTTRIQPRLTNGLVNVPTTLNAASFWKLDEASGTRNDSIGTNHLTDNNTVTQAVGKVGNAAQFTAANAEYLSIASNASLQTGDIDFTLWAWIYLDSTPNVQTIISKYGAVLADQEYWVRYNGFGPFFQALYGGNSVTDTGFAPSASTWNLVIFWHDSTANTINIQINARTPVSNAEGTPQVGTAPVWIGKTDTGNFLDGRADAVGFVKRVLTAGERAELYNSGAGQEPPFADTLATLPGVGQVNFDGLTLKRIYRYVFYDPRLGSDALPEVEVASQSIFFAGKTHGQGDFSLLDADGLVSPVLATMLLHHKAATIYVGGTFSDGREVYRDDWRALWPGLTGNPEWTDGVIKFQADDARAAYDITLPLRKYDDTTPLAATESIGAVRPYVWSGNITGVRFKPVRISTDATTGYGIYECADILDALAKSGGDKVGGTIVVWAYPSEELAALHKAGLLLTTGSYTYDTATALLTIADNVRNFLRGDGGDLLLDFILKIEFGGVVYKIDYAGHADHGTGTSAYTAEGLAAAIQATMRIQTGDNLFFAEYSNTTHKFTIYRLSVGTLSLNIATGWQYLGFTSDTQYNGATSYTADEPTFLEADRDHHIRVGITGFVDDSLGTMTGAANGLVTKHADVAHYVLSQFAKVPAAQIDAASFATGRGPEARIILDGTETVSLSEFLARCERGALADIVIDGDGVWRWRPYVAGAAAARDFYDRDFFSFAMWRDTGNIYKLIRLQYGRDPQRGVLPSVDGISDTGVSLKHGRPQVAEWMTWLDDASPGVASTVALKYARLSAADPWVVQFAARGKLADLLIGDVITLTRARSVQGSLVAARYRVVSLRHNGLTGVSTCTAVEDVSFL